MSNEQLQPLQGATAAPEFGNPTAVGWVLQPHHEVSDGDT